MTRDYTFTLTIANQWYNIWILINSDPSYIDPKFTTGNYTPNMVSVLKIQNLSSSVAAAVISRSDSKLEAGQQLTYGQTDTTQMPTNSIDLTQQNVKSSAAGIAIYVSLTSL